LVKRFRAEVKKYTVRLCGGYIKSFNFGAGSEDLLMT